MLAAYKDVGNNFQVVQGRLERGLAALQGFESVPRRWPLARLTVPFLNSVDYIGVLAGCCWEVLITRQDPEAARSLTSQLNATCQSSLLIHYEPR